MDIQIKKYADSHNLKELKYIFVDSLDVDPTFARYEEEYNYCKSIPGLLETHVELTPFTHDKNLWTEEYWSSLKTDLIKNFSDQRMMHMKEVAQVFLAEKVERILNERDMLSSHPLRSSIPLVTSDIKATPTPVTSKPIIQTKTISKQELQNQEIEAQKRHIAEINLKATEAEQADMERIKRKEQMYSSSSQHKRSDNSPKKAIGIAVAAFAVTIIILILILK